MFVRPARGLSGGGVSSGEGLNVSISVDESQLEQFFGDIQKVTAELRRMPLVVAGPKYGTPLVQMLRDKTPKSKENKRGGHLANFWRQTDYEGPDGAHVYIYNASSRADILSILELGARRHTIMPARKGGVLHFMVKGKHVFARKVIIPKMPGRFFIRSVSQEADRRSRKFIDDVLSKWGK